jgi:hypothetical protein
MNEKGSLNHTRWECKYHLGFIPKYRRKALCKERGRCWREVLPRLIIVFKLAVLLSCAIVQKLLNFRVAKPVFGISKFPRPGSKSSRKQRYNSPVIAYVKKARSQYGECL